MVIETALRLFSERGYLAVRVEDIAREAGVSRATFYKHFAEREEILAMLLTKLLGGEDEAASSTPTEGDLGTRVKATARAIVDTMLEQEALARFVYSLPVRHEALVNAEQLPRPSAFRRLDELLHAASEAGGLRDGVPSVVVRVQVHAAVETAMREWATGQVTDPHQRLSDYLDVVLYGALATQDRTSRP